MAEKSLLTEFVYHNIELYKSESLGCGSYGGVCKAKCDGLLCAAKIMHPTLFDLSDPGTASYLSKFREECHLLSLARHPNIVQYLGTFTDPDTRLPVLLMELCEESLTAFLERSPGPLSYHIQVDICHDIALALVYLHSNGLIHRDLTGNNILMIAGPRAKITDFGMSKLTSVNLRLSALTLCPGNVLYMSPEALDEAKFYTAKLDMFSYGVLVIQILTRQFPNPTDRFQHIQVNGVSGEVRLVVPETERRIAHLKLIPDAHSLKPLAMYCIKNKEVERPSALELSERLSELKQSTQYRMSRYGVYYNIQVQRRMSEQERVVDGRYRGEQQAAFQINQLQIKEKELEVKMSALASRNQELERQYQASLQQKDKTITDLQQTISAHERKIQQLEQHDTASRDTPHQKTIRKPQITSAAGGGRDISKMKWRKGKNAPKTMWRGAAVVLETTAYFRPSDSVMIYSYYNIKGEEQWSQLPDNPNKSSGLVVIDGLLTSVGGFNGDYSNVLLSLRGVGGKKMWSKIFPPMPTARNDAACVTNGKTLVVAGGVRVGKRLNTVEVMNTNTKQWATASPLLEKCSELSATVCGDKLYLAGGYRLLKSVFTCSLSDLLTPTTKPASSSSNVWKEISSLPVEHSTLVSFGGDLLAIGGEDDTNKPTSTVYRYDSHTDSWTVASLMKNKRSWCFAVSLSDSLLVVGGLTSKLFSDDTETNTVELLHP